MSTVGMQIIGTLHGVGQARDLLNSSNGPVTTCDSSETWPIEIVRSLRVSIRRGTKGLPIFLEATDVCRSIKTLFNLRRRPQTKRFELRHFNSLGNSAGLLAPHQPIASLLIAPSMKFPRRPIRSLAH